MELRNYVNILRKNWSIIIPMTLVSLTIAMVISYVQPRSYQSISTYVSTLDTSMNSISDAIYGLDTLAQRQSIFVTYCEVMTSQSVREIAYQLIGINPATIDLSHYQILCNVLPQANVVMVIVQGSSPTLTTRLNDAIGVAGTARANSLYRYFGLERLDAPIVKETATSSNRIQTGLLGGILGLVVSVSLAFVLEYLHSPIERMELLVIRDAKLGVYNERYFRQRLAEEISRARNRHRPISIALLRLIPSEHFAIMPEAARDMLLRSAALWMRDATRQGDILASLGRDTFAMLLPETPGDEAYTFLSRVHADLRAQTFGTADYVSSFGVNSGLVEASGGILDLRAMLAKGAEALQAAEQTGENAIELVRTSPRPFALDTVIEQPYPEAPATQSAGSPFTTPALKEVALFFDGSDISRIGEEELAANVEERLNGRERPTPTSSASDKRPENQS
jgi:diguanylate cyclase (GGDEF)-like protein